MLYIPENRARELIEHEVKSNAINGFIKNPEGFAQHCIYTGNIAYDVSKRILQRHPSLIGRVNPEIVRIEGFMHDFSKILEGDDYHEIGTAYIILTKGDEMGLVAGESKAERAKILKEAASLVPPDYALFEELGGYNFPKGALYKCVNKFLERISQLRTDLSKNSNPLTIAELTLPFTLNQQIATFADLTNVNGERVSIEKRMDEIIKRYSAPEQNLNPTVAKLTQVIKPRILIIGKTIESLIGQI